jgi:D-alanyl-D-alanine dipeptidase
MRKTSADIYSTPDEFQTVLFEYDYRITKDGVVMAKEVKLKLPLLVPPTDLKNDIEIAIADDLRCSPAYVKVSCAIQRVAIQQLNTATNEPLFI